MKNKITDYQLFGLLGQCNNILKLTTSYYLMSLMQFFLYVIVQIFPEAWPMTGNNSHAVSLTIILVPLGEIL